MSDWIRLNVFQRILRGWDSLHAYNAAQMMKLVGRPDRERLRQTWRETLIELGLGPVRTAEGRFRWETSAGTQTQIDVIEPPVGATIDQLMTDELNRPFDHEFGLPFRAFVIAEADGYFAGVIYHHWVADSSSIRLLLREWFLRLHAPSEARRTPLPIARRGYWHFFGPERSRWTIGDAVLSGARWNARFRKARRVDPEGFKDLSIHFSLHTAPAGLIDTIVTSARRRGVTVNDIFLAAMARVCDQLVPVRLTPRRPDVALGTIVDLRSRSKRLDGDAFGLFLGFTSIFVRPRELENDELLLQRINYQNAVQKQAATAESSMIRMFGGLVVARMLKPEGQLEFYRKRAALAAGISNVNLNRDWPSRYFPDPLLEYVRVSPVGPLLPVVFTPTTLGNTLNFGLTCRQSVIARGQEQPLAEMFLAQLNRLAAC